MNFEFLQDVLQLIMSFCIDDLRSLLHSLLTVYTKGQQERVFLTKKYIYISYI
jgi:hypothetical protein